MVGNQPRSAILLIFLRWHFSVVMLNVETSEALIRKKKNVKYGAVYFAGACSSNAGGQTKS